MVYMDEDADCSKIYKVKHETVQSTSKANDPAEVVVTKAQPVRRSKRFQSSPASEDSQVEKDHTHAKFLANLFNTKVTTDGNDFCCFVYVIILMNDDLPSIANTSANTTDPSKELAKGSSSAAADSQ
jgi:hypothetical protein